MTDVPNDEGPAERDRDALVAVAAAVDRATALAPGVLVAGGGAALLLGAVGVLSPLAWALLALPAIAAAVVVTPRPQPLRDRRDALAWCAALAVVAVMTVVNVQSNSSHALSDADPGLYINASRQLATEGTLLVESAVGPFADDEALNTTGTAHYDVRDDGRIYIQFFHLLSSILAVATWIGGDRLLFAMPALLAGLALLSVHRVARALLPPWFAAAATAALAVNTVQVYFSRDAFSEILVQLLAFGGLAVLLDAMRTRSVRGFVLAGVVVGAIPAARIDGLLIVAPFLLFALLSWHPWSHADDAVDVPRRGVAGFVAAALVTSGVGLAIGWRSSPQYWDDHIRPVYVVFAAAGLALVAGIAVAVLRPLAARWATARDLDHAAWWRRVALGVITVLALGLLYASVVRPLVEVATVRRPSGLVAATLEAEGHEPAPRRSFAEETVVWLRWYLGPVALLAAFGGLLAGAWAAITRRERVLVAVLGLVGLVLLVRIVRPSIVPVHPWAMRRFFAVAIPGLVLLAGYAAARLWGRDAVWIRRVAAVAIVVAMVAHPLWMARDTWQFRLQTGFREALVNGVCGDLPDDAAVLLLGGGQTNPGNYLPTVRYFCEVPAAAAPSDLPDTEITDLERRWQDEGRELFVVTSRAGQLDERGFARCSIRSHIADNPAYPSQSVTRPPSEVVHQRLIFEVAPASGSCDW